MDINGWREECQFISDMVGIPDKGHLFNHSDSVFLTYCQMQQKQAEKQGFHDVVTYIGHCIDDLKHAMGASNG